MAQVPVYGQGNSGVRLDFEFSRIVLASGDTLAGPVAMHYATDMLYLAQPDGTIRTLVPAAVAAFAVQGERFATGQGRYRAAHAADPTVLRLFRTLPWTGERPEQRPEPYFFEQLAEGPVLLLRRQLLVPRQIALNMSGPARGGGLSRALPVAPGKQPVVDIAPVQYRTVNELQDIFYLAWPTGLIRPLRNLKKDLLAAFPGQAQKIQTYAKAQSLGFATAHELHVLVSYANSLAIATTP
ncbi:hypothetical protein [Hymenobacter negativus]|uniref:Uncharacterized protein n=1 Tax=Hymenobacter negativus TaxID=2795026 RepID=A0ABS0Q4A7_9BACT|nr:hypothetical protein [Hymenobacter negativus]MBH8557178.1 hypothetical protein [Hymenobacter negativus]